ncbi:MAG: GMC family oxidoreductase [Pirellulaceae bacterium]
MNAFDKKGLWREALDALIAVFLSDANKPELELRSRASTRLRSLIEKLDETDQQTVKKILSRFESGWLTARFGFAPTRFSKRIIDIQMSIVERLLADGNKQEQWLLRSIQRISLATRYAVTEPEQLTPSQATYLDQIGYPLQTDQVPRPDRITVSKTAPGQRSFAAHYLVIGSGAAGAVMAAELAETGRDVLLVDEGHLVPRSELGGNEATANSQFYRTHGAFSLGENDTLITSAKTFGGGPVVNWGSCVDPPDFVLDEWARKFGFVDALSDDFKHSLFTVRRRLQISRDSTTLNRQNELLKVGLNRIGIEPKILERNAVECSGCDRCEFGCPTGARRDTRQTYLLDAQRLGVYLLPGCRIDRLEFEGSTATSAIAHLRTEEGVVDAKLQFREVVVCSNAIESPALLLRSGLRARHLGKNLSLHPAVIVPAFFDTLVQGWHGPAQSVYTNLLENLDGEHRGALVETAPIHPGIASLYVPWDAKNKHARWMARLGSMAAVIVLARDRGGGEVFLNSQRQSRVRYRLQQPARNALAHGTIIASEAMFAAGAEAVITPTWGPLNLNSGAEAKLQRLKHADFKLFSAHQFSTCRISNSAKGGVVDTCGRVFGTKNVYVTDSSVLPTAPGVNPMLTITTVSHYLSQKIKAVT